MVRPIYCVARRATGPGNETGWDSGYWAGARPLQIARFHVASSRHHPAVAAKVVHSSRAIHILFRVEADRFVVCEKTEFQAMVCHDSCVEAFLLPVEGKGKGKGYFNFEMNCGGTLLAYYVEDPSGMNEGKGFTPLTKQEAKAVAVRPSLTEKKPFRMNGPVTWTVGCSIGLEAMEGHVGKLGRLEGQWWRGNFFKCADRSKLPHWASWASVGAPLRFHQPARYGGIYFQRMGE